MNLFLVSKNKYFVTSIYVLHGRSFIVLIYHGAPSLNVITDIHIVCLNYSVVVGGRKTAFFVDSSVLFYCSAKVFKISAWEGVSHEKC